MYYKYIIHNNYINFLRLLVNLIIILDSCQILVKSTYVYESFRNQGPMMTIYMIRKCDTSRDRYFKTMDVTRKLHRAVEESQNCNDIKKIYREFSMTQTSQHRSSATNPLLIAFNPTSTKLRFFLSV